MLKINEWSEQKKTSVSRSTQSTEREETTGDFQKLIEDFQIAELELLEIVCSHLTQPQIVLSNR